MLKSIPLTAGCVFGTKASSRKIQQKNQNKLLSVILPRYKRGKWYRKHGNDFSRTNWPNKSLFKHKEVILDYSPGQTRSRTQQDYVLLKLKSFKHGQVQSARLQISSHTFFLPIKHNFFPGSKPEILVRVNCKWEKVELQS